MNRLILSVFLVGSACLAGCGGGGGGGGSTPPAISVTISPKAISLLEGAVQPFTSTVTNTTNTAVTYTILDVGGGTITADGHYTAPASVGTFHVRASSVADPTKSDTATVTVTAPIVSVSVTPPSANLLYGATQSFVATVTGSSNTNVTWKVTEDSSNTWINSAGLFTAPFATGTYHVVATSVADNTKSATATVTVTAPPISIAISPKTITLNQGGTVTFGVTLTNTSNLNVNFAVVEAGGGTVTSAGVYTAPLTAGTYHVTATSVADSSKSDTATITVTSDTGGASGTIKSVKRKP